ncbi:MAG: GNAT family N-acetyltransferase [Alphaproteobacteria bacterium]|nr:GNAT family N-acetyltransferase [Alphaproteobacteria bacterium]
MTGSGIRDLGPADLDGVVALGEGGPVPGTAAARARRDAWGLMLADGKGWVLEISGRIAAAVAALPFDGFAHLHAVADGKGAALRLVGHAAAEMERRGLAAAIDVAVEDRPLFEKIGFRPLYLLRRYVLERAVETPPPPWGVAMRRLGPADFADVAAYDAPVFGADRGSLLAALQGRRPTEAWLARGGGTVVGFALGRETESGMAIGPAVADHPVIALGLISRAARELRRPVVFLVPDDQVPIVGWLAAHGASAGAAHQRMIKDRNAPVDDADRIYAVAGPDLG